MQPRAFVNRAEAFYNHGERVALNSNERRCL